MKRIILILLFASLFLHNASAQNSEKIDKQEQVIASIEKRIANDEGEIKKLRQGKATAQVNIRSIVRQIDSRNQLITAAEKQSKLLDEDISSINTKSIDLRDKLEKSRAEYAIMVREAYRNYNHNNYITYIFASKDFSDMARKLTNLRGVAAMRERKIEEIENLSNDIKVEVELLDKRKKTVVSNQDKLSKQRGRLKNDESYARNQVKNLSNREQSKLKEKMKEEQLLGIAKDQLAELRKLVKGNRVGISFSKHTSKLSLPVVGGWVKSYKEEMAEVVGAKGSKVRSIYEGKVFDVRRLPYSNRYIVQIAHGEYISSYSNLESITIKKNDNIAKDQEIGVIGHYVEFGEPIYYRVVFRIYPPLESEKMTAKKLF